MKFMPIYALLLTAGCLMYTEPQQPYWERNQQNPNGYWDNADTSTKNVVGLDNSYKNTSNPVKKNTNNNASLSAKIRILEARIEELERIIAKLTANTSSKESAPTPAASSTPVKSAQPLKLYRVNARGKLAWIARGKSSDVFVEQLFDVVRNGHVIATAKVFRVWEDSAELVIEDIRTKVRDGDELRPK